MKDILKSNQPVLLKKKKLHYSHGIPNKDGGSFPGGSAGKESTCNAGDLGLIPRLGRAPGEGKGYPLQYSGLENSMDYIVHGVAKNRTQLNNFHSISQLLLEQPN